MKIARAISIALYAIGFMVIGSLIYRALFESGSGRSGGFGYGNLWVRYSVEERGVLEPKLQYDVPKVSDIARKDFTEHQLPIVNILHLDGKKALLAGALFWFEKQGEQGGAGQPATRPVVEPEGSEKLHPDSEGRSR